MKKKLIICFLVVSVLANGWFFYKWQQQETIYASRLVSTLHTAAFESHSILPLSPEQISEEAPHVSNRLQSISNAFASVAEMYHPYADIPFEEEEFRYFWALHTTLERKHLPIVEKLEYTTQSLPDEEEEMLREFSTNVLKSGVFREYNYIKDSNLYMESVKEFLRLEGSLTPEDQINLPN